MAVGQSQLRDNTRHSENRTEKSSKVIHQQFSGKVCFFVADIRNHVDVSAQLPKGPENAAEFYLCAADRSSASNCGAQPHLGGTPAGELAAKLELCRDMYLNNFFLYTQFSFGMGWDI